MRRIGVAGVSLAALAATVCAQQRGEQLYQSQCAYCHGRDGEGGRGPSLRRTVFHHAPDDASLVRVVRRGLPDSGMPGTSLSDAEAALVAAYVRGFSRIAPAPLPGDPARGQALYSAKGLCGRCHTIRGRGGAFGPDLTAIGRRRSHAHLRASLTDPASDLPQGFVLLSATTAAGARIEGARISEDTFSVRLRDASGKVHSFFKSELSRLDKDLKASPMPSYQDALSAAELDDLVSFLATLQDEP